MRIRIKKLMILTGSVNQDLKTGSENQDLKTGYENQNQKTGSKNQGLKQVPNRKLES